MVRSEKAPDTPEREPEMQDTPPCQHPNNRPEAPEKAPPVFLLQSKTRLAFACESGGKAFIYWPRCC